MRRVMRVRLQGARGLVTAVIAQAVNDWRNGTKKQHGKARAYFAGKVYKYHLTVLGLPKDWLPVGVDLD